MSDHSPLLHQHLPQIRFTASEGAFLDLACGSGRNGLYLIENGLPVVFADNNETALTEVGRRLDTAPWLEYRPLATLWPVDLEHPGSNPLEGGMFGGIMVFRYLHRPLFAAIKRALRPGGLLIYETFTVDQVQFGRPSNPDYLLRHGELKAEFADWEILHSFEGVIELESSDRKQAVAQLVAKKPQS